MHAFKLSFLRKMGGERALPVHVAKKPIPWMNEGKVPGFKLEYFVFDALSKASNPLIYEVPREGNFAPVKNAEGNDSPVTSRDALMRAHRGHLTDAGLTVSDSRDVEVSFRWVGNKKALQEGFEEGESPLTIP
jgi:UDP-N-acetylglucosamine/UDP-N-acetylgalactosamine diphosphorylase